MNLSLDNFYGKHPHMYAQKILKECGFERPPICEQIVTGHLGLDIREITFEHIENFAGDRFLEMHEHLETACSWLQREPNGQSHIYVRSTLFYPRKRMSIFHECGHAILPWHKELNYICGDKDIDPQVHNQLEREAYECAAEFLMPREMFLREASGLNIGIDIIQYISEIFISSLEATAIRYVSLHPGMCALLMAESTEVYKKGDAEQKSAEVHQTSLPFMTKNQSTTHDELNPLRVKYFAKSLRFPKYVRPGTPIYKDNLIFESGLFGEYLRGQIHASALGSSANVTYNAECRPVRSNTMVMTLLWLPDPQISSDFTYNGVPF